MSLEKQALIEFIGQKFGIDHDDLHDGANLFSTGILDSFHMLDLISFVESQSGIRIKPTEVTLTNLDSVDQIMNFLERKL